LVDASENSFIFRVKALRGILHPAIPFWIVASCITVCPIYSL